MTTQTRTTAEIIQHHLEAVGAKDFDAILSDYADSAVVITQDGVFEGKAAVTEFWKGFITLLTPEFLGAFEVTKLESIGDVGYFTWKSGAAVPLGADTLVCGNGLISVQTVAAYIPS
jgi:ketosteroid isomerase-like protein